MIAVDGLMICLKLFIKFSETNKSVISSVGGILWAGGVYS